MPGSSCTLAGASRPTRPPRCRRPTGPNRSRTCTNPTTLSREPAAPPGSGSCGLVDDNSYPPCRPASTPSRVGTSVRGTITSCRLPVTGLEDVLDQLALPAAQRLVGGDDVAAAPPRRSSRARHRGRPRTGRTTTSVDFESNQITGRDARSRSRVGATSSEIRSARCRAARFGSNSPPWQRQVGDDEGDRDEGHPGRWVLGARVRGLSGPPPAQHRSEVVGERRGAPRQPTGSRRG